MWRLIPVLSGKVLGGKILLLGILRPETWWVNLGLQYRCASAGRGLGVDAGTETPTATPEGRLRETESCAPRISQNLYLGEALGPNACLLPRHGMLVRHNARRHL